MKFGEIRLSEEDSQAILKEISGSTTSNKNIQELLKSTKELYENKYQKENTQISKRD